MINKIMSIVWFVSAIILTINGGSDVYIVGSVICSTIWQSKT